jgi:hypothetical protein
MKHQKRRDLPVHPASFALDFFTLGKLAGLQEGFDQITFTTDGHAGEFFEPTTAGNFRFQPKPIGQQFQLTGGNFSVVDPIQQVVEQPGRKVVAANLRHDYPP